MCPEFFLGQVASAYSHGILKRLLEYTARSVGANSSPYSCSGRFCRSLARPISREVRGSFCFAVTTVRDKNTEAVIRRQVLPLSRQSRRTAAYLVSAQISSSTGISSIFSKRSANSLFASCNSPSASTNFLYHLSLSDLAVLSLRRISKISPSNSMTFKRR